MITYKKLAEKFEDKGIDTSVLFLNLPQPPLFDPSCLELSTNGREELYDRFIECNKWRFDHYREKLEELDVWIDHQNYR
jgi:hypothetical protein